MFRPDHVFPVAGPHRACLGVGERRPALDHPHLRLAQQDTDATGEFVHNSLLPKHGPIQVDGWRLPQGDADRAGRAPNRPKPRPINMSVALSDVMSYNVPDANRTESHPSNSLDRGVGDVAQTLEDLLSFGHGGSLDFLDVVPTQLTAKQFAIG